MINNNTKSAYPYDGYTGDRADGVVLVIDVDLITVKDCCVACVSKVGCAHEGHFGDAGGYVYVSRRCAHIGGKFADLSGFLLGPVGQAEDFI